MTPKVHLHCPGFGPAAQCDSGEGGSLSLFPRPPPPSNWAPRAGPTTSTAGRLKLLKHVILHINLAHPVHHPSFFGNAENKVRPFEYVLQTPPPPLIHTGSKGPPPPELQWTAGLGTRVGQMVCLCQASSDAAGQAPGGNAGFAGAFVVG